MNDSPKLTADWIEIVQLLNQFGTAIDLRDWTSFQSLFAERVEFDYSAIDDIAGTFDAKAIADNARRNFGGFTATQHAITNHQIDLSDNSANCRAYVRAMHVLANEKMESMLEIGGYYQAQLIRTNSSWKIKGWKFTILWSIGSLELFDLAKESS